MKVAQVVRRFSFDEWGGTENVVWNSTLALRKLGIESEILATSALSLPGEEVRDGVRIRRFRYFYPYFPLPGKDRLALDKKGGSPYSPSLSRAMAKGGYDLIHIHAGGRIAMLAVAAAQSRAFGTSPNSVFACAMPIVPRPMRPKRTFFMHKPPCQSRRARTDQRRMS